MSRALPLVFLLFIIPTNLLTGQKGCPVIADILNRFYEEPEAIVTIEAEVRAACPAALDSLSIAYHKRSVYAYGAEEPLATAIAFAERALRVQQELYQDSMALPLAKSLANLGLFHRNNGEAPTAERYLLAAEDAFRELDIYSRRYRNREQLVFLWQDAGDYGRAEEILPLLLAEAQAEEDTYRIAEAHRLYGRQYNQTRQYPRAVPHLRQADALFSSIGEAHWAMESQLELGRTYYHLKEYTAAKKTSLNALRQAEASTSATSVISIQNHLGLIALRSGEQAEAKDWFTKARKNAEDAQDPIRLAATLDNTAELLLLQNEPQEAVNFILQAISVLIPDWSFSQETPLPRPAQYESASDRTGIFIYLGDLARAYTAAGQVVEAREALAAADGLADQLRAEYGASVSKLFWRERALPIYDHAIRLSQGPQDVDNAFYFLEKSRSILLLEALLRADADANLPTELKEALARSSQRLRQNQRALAHLEKKVAEKEDADKKKELQSGILSLRDTLKQLRTTAMATYPQLAALINSPPVIAIDQAQAQLAEGGWDRQLTYFLGGDTARVMVLSPTEASLHSLGPTKEVERSIRNVLSFFGSAEAIDQDPAGFLRASNTAYETLLAWLPLKSGERLLVLPDGLLNYLPFGALVKEAGGSDLATAEYLLRTNSVSYAASATVLKKQNQVSFPGQVAMALAFCPFIEKLPGSSVAALPFSSEEVAALANLYPTLTQDKGEASRVSLLKAMGNKRIVHLSTHAYATAEGKEQPRILTATEPVYLTDIYGLQLGNELVTLSACQSNIGPLAKGEGVLSLGRAFASAGARGVVASLWSLNDRATADITSSFYQKLAEGHPKPLALHEAQLAYLNREDLPAYLKSPYYWAGLTYYGDAGTLAKGFTFPWWSWLLISVGLLGVLFFLRSRRRTVR